MMFESAILCFQACVLMLQTIVLFSALRSLCLLEGEIWALREEVHRVSSVGCGLVSGETPQSSHGAQ